MNTSKHGHFIVPELTGTSPSSELLVTDLWSVEKAGRSRETSSTVDRVTRLDTASLPSLSLSQDAESYGYRPQCW